MIEAKNLPEELRETGLFCVWRYEQREGKLTKSPYNPRTGGGAMSNNPATFAPLKTALQALGRDGYDGVGAGIFNGLGAIDIDNCVSEDGEISDLALDIMRIMAAYTEYSPSGRGIRILFKVSGFVYDKAKYYIKNPNNHVESYIAGCTNRYVTVTGNVISAGDFTERREQLQQVLDKYMRRTEKKIAAPAPSAPVDLDDLVLVKKMEQSSRSFPALWSGDKSGYASASEADMALCNILAWWTNRDAERVDRLFRQSGLMREKWDRPQAGTTYGAITIQNAIDSCKGGYDPQAFFQARAEPPIIEKSNEAADGFAHFTPFKPPDLACLPPFPVEYLPPVLRDIATATAENLQVAVDMPALAELAVAALCIQGKFIINPKPGWVEPLNLYAVIVALPSDRKSPTMKVATRHVYSYVSEENHARKPLIDEYNTKRTVLVKRINGMVDQAARPKAKNGQAVDMQEIIEMQYQLADLEQQEIRPMRLLADDVTPEALISLMAENNGKMAVVSSEGGIFDIAAGRYSDKLNVDVFLKAYSGDYIQIDRKGRKSESIEHPALTMLLTVQPSVLESIMGNTVFMGRGFLARFLYSLPVSTVGRRRYETRPIPQEVEAAYNLLLDSLLNIEDLGEARIIKLSPEAHNEARRFFEALEPRLRDDLEDIEGWAGKYHGQIMRIAGILHCCAHGRNAAQEPVSLDTMRKAQSIGDYFLAHAMAAFQIMGLSDDQETKDAKYILKRLKDSGKTQISKKDLFDLCRGHFEKTDYMEPGLSCLVEHGYIRLEKAKNGGSGRPSYNICINPLYSTLE